MVMANNFGVLLPTRGVLVYAGEGGPRVELNWQMAEGLIGKVEGGIDTLDGTRVSGRPAETRGFFGMEVVLSF